MLDLTCLNASFSRQWHTHALREAVMSRCEELGNGPSVTDLYVTICLADAEKENEAARP